ncbi:hypothetical protein MRX96_035959 [Rhipicephalus microplus]
MSYDSGYSYCSSSQYAAPSHSWDVNHSGTSWGSDGVAWQQGSAWDPHADAIPPPKQSPARESLDSRIELLLKQTEGRAGFLDTGAPPFASPPFGETPAPQQSSPVPSTPQSSDGLAAVSLPPLPPDSSPLPPLPERDELPPPPPEEDDEAMELLSTPPSPFLSLQEYHHWARITREARTRDLSDSELDDRRADVTMQSSEETNQSVSSTRDSTPVHDELPEPAQEEDATANNADDDDDDRMSLSSLSSGEEKLQVNAPLPEPPKSQHVPHRGGNCKSSCSGLPSNTRDVVCVCTCVSLSKRTPHVSEPGSADDGTDGHLEAWHGVGSPVTISTCAAATASAVADSFWFDLWLPR